MNPPPWQDDVDLRRLIDAISVAGGSARLVGGCVRDWLSGRTIGDLDLATDLLPNEAMQALSSAGFRVIPTGIAHGTVTAVRDGRSFEITTLRTDLETDGRHARVGFTTDWAEDARRRDFTINAMYADLDGTTYDPVGQGLRDLDDRLLRFVGDPATRIREDYLRILRFHRFGSELGFRQDPDGLTACAALASGMAQLSVERIWQEMKRLLGGSERWPVLQNMAHDGTLKVLLPEAELADWQQSLPGGDALLFLAALIGPNAKDIAGRWKLSGAETRRLCAAASGPGGESGMADRDLLRLAWRESVQTAIDRLIIDAARNSRNRSESIRMLQNWQRPDLPVRGQDALDLGVAAGRDIGRLIQQVEDWWLGQDFRPDRAACLAKLRRFARRS